MSEYPTFDGGESHFVTKTTVITNLTHSSATTATPETDAGPAPGSANVETIARAPAIATPAAADTPDPLIGGVMTGDKS